MDYKHFIEHIRLMAEAHQDKVLPTAKDYRVFANGEKNPYFTHPLWCAMMILLETELPESVRVPGAQALLFHDVLEDTSATLPDNLSPEVRAMVEGMTFDNWDDEVRETLQKGPMGQLLKLYDKTATLYDWVPNPERKEWMARWIDFTQKLITTVRAEYGELNIVILAEGLIAKHQKALGLT